MDIVLHLGAHLTDEAQLRDCLRANQSTLSQDGVLVPRPRDCLAPVLNAASELAADRPVINFMEKMRTAVNADASTQRLVLSAPGLLARLPETTDGRALYPQAVERILALRTMFTDQPVQIYFCIRNPATFIPALLASTKSRHAQSVRENLSGEALRWSQLVTSFRTHWPEAELTIWCDEDTPFLWHRLLSEVAGGTPEGGFAKSYDWFRAVMVDGGAEKLEAYLKAAPAVDEEHRQKVIAAFLDKFCDETKLDVDISATGWNEETVDVLSELYEDDVDLIGNIEGVRLLQP